MGRIDLPLCPDIYHIWTPHDATQLVLDVVADMESLEETMYSNTDRPSGLCKAALEHDKAKMLCDFYHICHLTFM